jgi:hypothetical protein
VLPDEVTGPGLVPIGLGMVPVRGGYGAIFASPGEPESVIREVNCPEPEVMVDIRGVGWLFVTMKQSRWLAKIVTNLLTLLTVLGVRSIFK